MKTREDLFIGRPIFWLLWIAIVAVLAALGLNSYHVRDFVPFQFIVLGLAVAAVAVIVGAHRKGERVTREPLD